MVPGRRSGPWRIAIIGGGIGGLAAALALARAGHAVTLHEAAPGFAEVGAGLQVSPNGVAVLEALGVRDAAAARASAPEALEMRDHRGDRLVARMPFGATAAARYGRPYWQMHRADLIGVLAAAAAAAGVDLRSGTPARLVGTAEAPRVAAAGEEAGFDAVIAADGVRSRVRADWFGGGQPRFTGNVAWRGLVPAAALPQPVAAVTTVRMAPGRHLVTYPLRGGSLVNFVAVEERAGWVAEGWSHPDDPDRLRAAFAGFTGARPLLAAVDATFLWGLFAHPRLPQWHRGRVALLGDACHPMLPFLAQGATMALEDAFVLADALAESSDVPAGLAAYSARRLDRASRVQAAAARNGGLFHLRPGLREPAQLALGLLARAAPERLLGRFDWLYAGDVTAMT